jgi:hypothetical protein
VNVDFVKPSGKGAGIGLANPLSLEGTVKGLSVGDFLQFGGVGSSSIDVKGFELTNNRHDLTITYGNNQHATYHLTDLQANTTFKLVQGSIGQEHYSELLVVKNSTSLGNGFGAAGAVTEIAQDVSNVLQDIVGIIHHQTTI